MKNTIIALIGLICVVCIIGLTVGLSKANAGMFDPCDPTWHSRVILVDTDGNKLWKASQECGSYPVYYVTNSTGGRTMTRVSSGKSTRPQEVQTIEGSPIVKGW